ELLADQPAHVVRLDDAADGRGGPRHADLLTRWLSLPVGVSLSARGKHAARQSGLFGASHWGRATPANARGGVRNDALEARAARCSARWRGRRRAECGDPKSRSPAKPVRA